MEFKVTKKAFIFFLYFGNITKLKVLDLVKSYRIVKLSHENYAIKNLFPARKVKCIFVLQRLSIQRVKVLQLIAPRKLSRIIHFLFLRQ